MKPTSFPLLVWALAEEHHEGALLNMALNSDIPQSTLWRWVRGMPTKPNPDLVKRLCVTYDLKFPEVWEIIRRDEDHKLAGKKVALPDLSNIRRGPIPLSGERRKRRRKALTILAGATLLAATAGTPAVASQAGSHTIERTAEPDYVKKRRRHRVAATTRRGRRRGFPYRRAA